ncbi:uncharacterized protein LOC132977963 isoform X2 [Labrus mixtus]|uniref:uncharacterized protein LOC132977963 isoform X2 n=1 Tax=Labrus mixtus TaxID=508554 RepID=UPI0029C07E0D|nr:uncharacterized protein LOC132977963 isoform X2 [Labrus mixtus]
MAGHLLLVIFMCSFPQLKTQALLPPALTVDPAMITETDSVTVNCQPPSSVSVSMCYFLIMRERPAKTLACRQTLTGTELLKMSHQSSPAEVKVACFYLSGSESPESAETSIIIRTSLPPKLIVNPPVINETDSVTVHCQPPSSVSASKCLFYTLSGEITLSCLQTLKGTELLKMVHQGSPAEVKLTCFYMSKFGDKESPSPHSATSSITILRQKPELSLHHSPGELMVFTCSLPVSANHDTRCHLYFGEASRPVETNTIMSQTNKEKQSFCQFYVNILNVLSQLRLVQQSEASCDYTLGDKPDSLSPRSDGYSLTNILKIESNRSPTMSAFTMNTGTVLHSGLTVSTISNAVSTFLTSVKPPSGLSVSNPDTKENTFPEIPPKTTSGLSVSNPDTKENTFPEIPPKTTSGKWILKFVVIASGSGVTVGVMFLVSAALCNRRRAGSEEQKRQESESHHYTTCYYFTISDEAAVYSTEGLGVQHCGGSLKDTLLVSTTYYHCN